MLEIETLYDHLWSNTYIVGNEKDCFIIDPSNDVRNIKKMVNKRNVLGIFLTHGHFDHFRTLQDTMNLYDAKIYLHKEALNKLKNPNISCSNMFGYNTIIDLEIDKYKVVHSGDKIILGEFEIKILTTPGHTNCSICILIENVMFSGDTLFETGVGRWDLPTGNIIELTKSIKQLLGLKTDYLVYPGHGDTTKIYDEIVNNPFYQRIK